MINHETTPGGIYFLLIIIILLAGVLGTTLYYTWGDLEKAQNNFERCVSDSQSLTRELTKSKVDNINLQGLLDQAHNLIAGSESKIQVMGKQLDDLAQQVTSLTQEVQSLKLQLANALNERDTAVRRTKELEAQIAKGSPSGSPAGAAQVGLGQGPAIDTASGGKDGKPKVLAASLSMVSMVLLASSTGFIWIRRSRKPQRLLAQIPAAGRASNPAQEIVEIKVPRERISEIRAILRQQPESTRRPGSTER